MPIVMRIHRQTNEINEGNIKNSNDKDKRRISRSFVRHLNDAVHFFM